jgi:phage-related protein
MRLGDGFSQRVADGINASGWNATFRFENLSSTDFATLLSFTDAIGSWGYFTYATPDGATTKFSIMPDQMSITAQSGSVWTVSISARTEWDL